jgi:hypothetical protein
MNRLIFFLLLLSSCLPGNHGKRNFNSNPERIQTFSKFGFRTDGVYYGYNPNSLTKDYGIIYFFFYNNRVLRNKVYLAGIQDTLHDKKWVIDFIERDVKYRDSTYGENNEGAAFLIESNFIKIQDFIYIPGSLSWDLRTFNGRVINDTTLYIIGCNTIARPDYCINDFYLKYIPMKKPDSTNRLMKRNWYWKKN